MSGSTDRNGKMASAAKSEPSGFERSTHADEGLSPAAALACAFAVSIAKTVWLWVIVNRSDLKCGEVNKAMRFLFWDDIIDQLGEEVE